ncbi:DUF5959 family protein [Streptomyces europaeiscabiei]|uniref:DUF5959 family protein n=1 Tax=Streptomyces europaeiscabiei TaxID=146819 RepID=UPI002E196585
MTTGPSAVNGMITTEDGQLELLRLADEENSVVVRVVGPTTPGLPWDGCLDVDIVVASEFANGHLKEVCLLPEDLENWGEALDLLAEGRPVEWMDDGRNPEVRITPKGPYHSRNRVLDAVEVTVTDPVVSLTSVRVLVRLPEDWVDAQRLRLDQVRRVCRVWQRGPLLGRQGSASHAKIITECDRQAHRPETPGSRPRP